MVLFIGRAILSWPEMIDCAPNRRINVALAQIPSLLFGWYIHRSEFCISGLRPLCNPTASQDVTRTAMFVRHTCSRKYYQVRRSEVFGSGYMSESWAGLDWVFDIIVQAVAAFWRSIYLFRRV
ncbi:uncharacterized protein APUU_71256S [Aspergillus puulaauensis]|uniref:Uncharacterized protein n=1 Tax=Aspergillus puulaauensis TaxID=1220207 RepID=A0A7R7XXS0_9EURO|nr:uncharacterized protein APUU_71256S [Aspergillus puulaauensis]BCS29686.1 hypothetical protein APUU_71256S [Aspergillus puulaauensis]